MYLIDQHAAHERVRATSAARATRRPQRPRQTLLDPSHWT